MFINDSQSVILIIDFSYVAHTCLHSAMAAYKKTFGDPASKEDMSLNEDYCSMVIDTFNKFIYFTKKKYRATQTIWAQDDSKKNIWRYEHCDTYKLHRIIADQTNEGPNVRACWPLLTDRISEFIDGQTNIALKVPKCEGDDIIAVLARHIKKNNKNSNVVIVSSDGDLAQLSDVAEIYDMYGKDVVASTFKKFGVDTCENPRDQFIKVKILVGDNTDHIASVFDRVHIKTAVKLLNNKELLKKTSEKPENEGWRERYKLNTQLINMEYIPEVICESIITAYEESIL